MASTRFDVLGIGNAIVDVIARTEDDFLAKQNMRKGAMQLIDEAQAVGDLRCHGTGGGGVRRLGSKHHRGRGEPRRPRGLHRQDQGRRSRPRVRARHPRCGRRLRNAARLGRAIDRALLRAGHAGRRAHHEHVSRRRPGPASERHRCRRRRRRPDHLSRGLPVGSAAREGGLPQGGKDRPRRRARRRAHAVGCVLRRPVSRGIPRSHPHRHGRYRLRQ